MQTQSQVRFYITQGDEQPVVKSVPVPKRLCEPKTVVEQPMAAAAGTPDSRSPVKSVAGLVRSAVKRTASPA